MFTTMETMKKPEPSWECLAFLQKDIWRINSIKWPCQLPLLKYVVSSTASYISLTFYDYELFCLLVCMCTTWMPGVQRGYSKAMVSLGLRVESYHVRFSSRAANTPNHLAISPGFGLMLCVLAHQIDSITWSSRVSRKRAWEGHRLWHSLPPGPLRVDSLYLPRVPSIRGGATAPCPPCYDKLKSLETVGQTFLKSFRSGIWVTVT